MSKRRKAPRERSTGWLVTAWAAGVLSLGLLYLAGSAVESDLGGFRSCSTNNSGLVAADCGKQSLNTGDLVLLGLFVLSACLVVALFTAAWRMTRRSNG